MYECDFVLAILRQITVRRSARHLSNRQPFGFEVALESLAGQISKTAHSDFVKSLL